MNKTFGLSQDSDTEYNRKITELTNKHSHFTKSQKQQSKMSERRSLGSGDDQDGNPVYHHLSKINKLFLTG